MQHYATSGGRPASRPRTRPPAGWQPWQVDRRGRVSYSALLGCRARLRGMRKPQFRLRVGDIRVFYDVTDESVEVLAIVAQAQAKKWLAEQGEADENRGPGEGEG